MVFPRYRTAVFVYGCFWHGDDCSMFKLPETRRDFWSAKIAGNRARDSRNHDALVAEGWRVLTVWECAQKGPARRPLPEVLAASSAFIRGTEHVAELSGERSGR